MTSILGISAFYHDSAAALIVDGKIVSAAQEERFSRKKHDSSYPFNAIEYILKESKLNINVIDHIVFFEKPFLKFERLLETYMAFAPKGFKSFSLSMPIWLREKLFQKKFLFEKLKQHDENFNNIKKNTYFFDVIYNPLETPFLKLAKLRSKNCINGLEMNKLQAMLAIKKVMKNLTSLRKIEKSLLKF